MLLALVGHVIFTDLFVEGTHPLWTETTTRSDWFGPPAYNVWIVSEKRKVIVYHKELIAFVLLFLER